MRETNIDSINEIPNWFVLMSPGLLEVLQGFLAGTNNQSLKQKDMFWDFYLVIKYKNHTETSTANQDCLLPLSPEAIYFFWSHPTEHLSAHNTTCSQYLISL